MLSESAPIKGISSKLSKILLFQVYDKVLQRDSEPSRTQKQKEEFKKMSDAILKSTYLNCIKKIKTPLWRSLSTEAEIQQKI